MAQYDWYEDDKEDKPSWISRLLKKIEAGWKWLRSLNWSRA